MSESTKTSTVKTYQTNPILRRELLSLQRSWRLPVLILVYNGIMLGLITGLYALSSSDVALNPSHGIDLNFMKGLYYFVTYSQLILLLLMIPAVTSGSFSGERQRGTLDILLVSAKSPWQLVSGKLQAGLYSFFILIVSSLPLYGVIGVYGGLGPMEVVSTLLTLTFIALFYGSLCLAFSAWFKKHQTAMVMSYAAVFLITVLSLVLTLMAAGFYAILAQSQPNQWVASLLYMNPFVVMMTQLDLQMNSSDNLLQMYFGYHPLTSLGIMAGLHLCLGAFLLYFAKMGLRRSQ